MFPEIGNVRSFTLDVRFRDITDQVDGCAVGNHTGTGDRVGGHELGAELPRPQYRLSTVGLH